MNPVSDVCRGAAEESGKTRKSSEVRKLKWCNQFMIHRKTVHEEEEEARLVEVFKVHVPCTPG